tara:strand:- start:112 stop:711 length:600 start_codon:yes stop_codon:yes gene_type:complete
MTLKKPSLGGDDNSPFPLFGIMGSLGSIIGRRRRGRRRKLELKGDRSGEMDNEENREEDDEQTDDRERGRRRGFMGIFGRRKGGKGFGGILRAIQAMKGRKSKAFRNLNETNDDLSGITGGIGSLFSDARLKENINKIGNSKNGIPIYEFNYIGGSNRYSGAIAQDLLEINPSVVTMDKKSGYYKVDYSNIDVNMYILN